MRPAPTGTKMNRSTSIIVAAFCPSVKISPCRACSSLKKSRGPVRRFRMRPAFVQGPISEKKTGFPPQAAASTRNARLDSGHVPVHAARASEGVSELQAGAQRETAPHRPAAAKEHSSRQVGRTADFLQLRWNRLKIGQRPWESSCRLTIPDRICGGSSKVTIPGYMNPCMRSVSRGRGLWRYQ
jgi:hypothetical protein